MKTIIALFLLLMTIRCSAHEMIIGTVLNERNEYVPGAAVRVFHERQLKGSATTDNDGHYTLKSLVPGVYDVL